MKASMAWDKGLSDEGDNFKPLILSESEATIANLLTAVHVNGHVLFPAITWSDGRERRIIILGRKEGDWSPEIARIDTTPFDGVYRIHSDNHFERYVHSLSLSWEPGTHRFRLMGEELTTTNGMRVSYIEDFTGMFDSFVMIRRPGCLSVWATTKLSEDGKVQVVPYRFITPQSLQWPNSEIISPEEWRIIYENMPSVEKSIGDAKGSVAQLLKWENLGNDRESENNNPLTVSDFTMWAIVCASLPLSMDINHPLMTEFYKNMLLLDPEVWTPGTSCTSLDALRRVKNLLDPSFTAQIQEIIDAHVNPDWTFKLSGVGDISDQHAEVLVEIGRQVKNGSVSKPSK